MPPPADIAADATRRSGPSLLLPFTIGHFANDWAPTAVWLIVPAMAVTMNLSPAEVGLLFTIHSTGSALAFLPAGVLADRVANRGRLLQITFWWVAVGYALAAFAPGYWSFALAPLSGGFLLLFMDWRHALLITVIPAAIMGLVFLRIAKHVPPAAQSALSPVDAIALWRAWMRPAGLALIVMISAYSMTMIALLAMTPLFLQTVHGLSPLVTGMAFSLMLLFGALLQPLIGKFSDQIGRRPVVVTGNLIAMVAAVAIALASGPGFAIAAMVVTATALVAIRSVVLASAVDYSGKREATTLGFTYAVMDGVGALGAVAAGALGNVDLRYAFILAGCLCAFTVVMAFVAPYTKEQE